MSDVSLTGVLMYTVVCVPPARHTDDMMRSQSAAVRCHPAVEAMVDVTFSRNASYASADAGDYSNVRLWQTPWRPMKKPTFILPQLGTGGRPVRSL